jgi:RNA polymerase sigma-70 factor (sigma-E family)
VEAVATDDEHEYPHRQAEFRAFFERHHRELSRFAYLLSGDHDAADDITADALTAAWTHWDRVRSAELPLAYVRRIVANLAADRVRKVVRERRGLLALGQRAERSAPVPDVPAVVDLRTALMALPPGKRACVVLRYAFDLSEGETARTLGISVGTVKSQTARGVADLERILQASELPPAETATEEVTPGMTPGLNGAARDGSRRSGGSRTGGPQPGELRAGSARDSGPPGRHSGPGLSTFTRARGGEPVPGPRSGTELEPLAGLEPLNRPEPSPNDLEPEDLLPPLRHLEPRPGAGPPAGSARLAGAVPRPANELSGGRGALAWSERRPWPLWRVGEA